MPNVQRVAILDPSEDTREMLRGILLGVESIWLDAECSRYEYFLDVIQQSVPDVAIVNLDSDPERGLQVIHHTVSAYPDLKIIAVSSRNDGQFILQVIRMGAKEFVGMPLSFEELLGALDRLRSSSDGGGGPSSSRSKIFAFAGARGGAGCTSLAVNVGCIMAQDPNNSVALIDLDLTMGDADVCLDIIPDYTLADVALNIDRIDLQLLKRSLSKHSSGMYLLPHPVQIDDAVLIHQDHISRVLSLMKMSFSHLILDLSKSYQPIDFAAMQLADTILLTIQLDVSNLRNVVRLMMSLNEREGLADKVKVIANRIGSNNNEISLQRAEATIGRPIFARIPNDTQTMMASRNNGVPLLQHAPKSKLFQSLLGLAETLLEGGDGSGGSAGSGAAGGKGPAKPAPKEKKGFFF